MTATAPHVNWCASKVPVHSPHLVDLSHAHTPPVVSDIVGQRGTVVCLADATLSDAIDLLTVHKRTAAGIVDDEGTLLGAITENDLLLAYTSGVRASETVRAWLGSGHARLPRSALPELTLQPSTTLLEAAVRMRAHASGDLASHHCVISDQGGAFHGILSSLDLARALCAVGPRPAVLEKICSSFVAELMKPRVALPCCCCGTTLGQALSSMASVHQNCVLVTESGGVGSQAVGILTPRDALRGFSEHVPLDIDVLHWFRALQPQWNERRVCADTQVSEAAASMAAHLVHHLVVTAAEDSAVVGVVSSSDLVKAIAAEEDIF